MKKQKAIVTIFAIVLIGLFSTVAFATSPSNDNFANAEVVSGMQVHITRNNISATKESGEPNHANNVGGKSVWFKWTAPMTRMMAISTNRSAGNIDTLIHIYIGTELNNLSTENFNNDIYEPDNLKSFARIHARQGITYYIVIDGASKNNQPAVEGSFTLDIQPSLPYQGADFDNDGMTDISVFRPSEGVWYINGSTRQITKQWGTNGDIPVVSSFSNGLVEYCVFRPSDGIWYYSTLGNFLIYRQFGQQGDIPVAESFGGEGSSVQTVFRPSNGVWYISTTQVRYYQFGLQGDIPVPGHYSPDHTADVAVFRPSNGVWYFMKRVNGNPGADTFSAVKFGQQGDKPVPGDYDGDGLLDVAVYRPSMGTWWVLRSSDSQAQTFQWGVAEDIPTTGDFDGDGKFDYAVFRPSSGVWYVHRSSNGSFQSIQFGANGDIPVTANRAF